MSIWRQLTRGLRALLKRNATDRDIADEVDQYLDEATASFEASGLSPEDARLAAKRQFGSVYAVREQVRDYGWENVVDAFVADLRYGVRRLRNSPAFTVSAALILAFGIAASTAIFSAVKPVLLESLPYPEADRLIMIWDGEGGGRQDVTFATYRELIQRSRSFESMAVMRSLQITLTGAGEPERVNGQYVSADYFRVLGVPLALGRDFQAVDDLPFVPNGPTTVIISDALWRRHFNTDPKIVGKQITLQDTPVTVAGVLPKGFENVLSPSAEIWSPLRYDPALPLNGREWGKHLRLVGRLRPGVPFEQAQQELDAIAQTKVAEFPRAAWASLPDGFIASSLQDDLTRVIKPTLLAVMGAAILLLVIACVNVTNLLLAQGKARDTEIAVRAALGASRARLTRQLVTEAALLSILGGVLGVAFAYASLDAIITLSPNELARAEAIRVDGAALAFALGLTTLIAVIIGLAPALHRSGGNNLHSQIQRGSTRIAGGRQLTQRSLVVVQVALAVILLINAGLLLRSLQHLFRLPYGFDASNVLTMQVQAAGQKFRDANTTHRFFAQVLQAVRRVPGVSVAGLTSQLPLTGDNDIWRVQFEGEPTRPGADLTAYRYAVSPGYLEAMGIAVKDGRALNSQDNAGGPLAVVISESLARSRFPGLNPISKRLTVGGPNVTWFTVVGVVADVKQASVPISRTDAVYMTAEQWTFAETARWVVIRTRRDTASLMREVRQAVWSIDKNQPIFRVATMDERLASSEARRRFALLLFEVFGCVALGLAAIGTYSLIAGNVAERKQEIGVRLAIGASRRNILTLVARHAIALAGLGIAIGTAGALAASSALSTLLFGISRFDSTTYVGVIALLMGVSAIACVIPAWRATRIRPSVVLKAD